MPPVDTRYNNIIKIWKRPLVGRTYFGFLDPSDGFDDPHAGVILDAITFEVVAHTWGKVKAEMCAKYFDELVREYNNAFNDFERNSFAGGKVDMTLTDLGTPNRRVKDRDKNGKPKYGLYTSGNAVSSLRNTMLSALEEVVRKHIMVVHDSEAIMQLQEFQRKMDGSIGSPSGGHDDYIMALACAWHIKKDMPTRTQFRSGYCSGYGSAR
jgi:hypothetical protein